MAWIRETTKEGSSSVFKVNSSMCICWRLSLSTFHAENGDLCVSLSPVRVQSHDWRALGAPFRSPWPRQFLDNHFPLEGGTASTLSMPRLGNLRNTTGKERLIGMGPKLGLGLSAEFLYSDDILATAAGNVLRSPHPVLGSSPSASSLARQHWPILQEG